MATTVAKEIPGMLKQSLVPDVQSFRAPFSERRFLLLAVDALLVVIASACAVFLWSTLNGRQLTQSVMIGYGYLPVVLLMMWFGLAWLNDLYHIPTAHNRKLALGRIIASVTIGLLISSALLFFAPVNVNVVFALIFWGLLLAMIGTWRVSYSVISNAVLPIHQRVLIVGTGTRSRAIAEVMEQSTDLSYQVMGYVHCNTIPNQQGIWGSPILGNVEDLVNVVNQEKVHQVVVASESAVEDDLFHALVHCQSNGVIVSTMPEIYEKLCYRIPIQHIDPSWGLYAMQDRPIFRRLHLTSKRLLDLSLFTLALPVFAVVFPILAIAIKLNSAGPVFYKQVRSGRGGKPFWIYKFRTMVNDAEENGKAQWAQKNDMRITEVGRFLRKTRLDELPQILNVLRDEMSFVGPRPERPEFITELEKEIPFYSTRMMVKPGLTGWAQIHYDYGNTVEDAHMKLQYDFYYVRYWSLWMDIYILFRTIAVVVQLKGM